MKHSMALPLSVQALSLEKPNEFSGLPPLEMAAGLASGPTDKPSRPKHPLKFELQMPICNERQYKQDFQEKP
jgi:hypothetical protein